ncbi:hypothetical protein KFE25_006880 [Diacronema lutheri]|uniref:Uncharacterized protein n=2 Tax=Diacronema lutheri TaxID=2081491 RepID=A0A8J6CHJ8_DIALT|nr:hypothetical protein KFE25_006880 [Diacronema lutheri]
MARNAPALAGAGAPTARRAKLLGPLEVVFLGTCSSAPSSTRNQQAVALRAAGATWLFDCGEATQKQMMASGWRTSAVARIFISHMHGDHIFGLPGMLCNVGTSWPQGGHHVTIVGPLGLRQWVRVALAVSFSSLGEGNTYSVHELVGLEADAARGAFDNGFLRAASGPLHPCERDGLDIAPDSSGVWHIPPLASDPPMRVRAAELSHRVPTVGFAALEDERPGGVDAASLLPILAAEGVPASAIGALKRGEPLSLPSGRVLTAAEFVRPSTRRKLVVLGDLSAASDAMCELASDCDLLVHEATNAYLERDRERQPTASAESVEAAATLKGHSTPQMAGRLARRVRARNLALTHFSAMYSGAVDEASLLVMAEIESLARQECKLAGTAVFAARDLMSLTVAVDGRVTVDAGPDGDEPAA